MSRSERAPSTTLARARLQPLALAALTVLGTFVAVAILVFHDRDAPLIRNAERSHFRIGPLVGRVGQTFRAADGVITAVRVNAQADSTEGGVNALLLEIGVADDPDLAVQRESRRELRAGSDPQWVELRFDPLPVREGVQMRFRLVAERGRPVVSLAASRFDLYPDGRVLFSRGPQWPDQDLLFQVIYTVRPVGLALFLVRAAPLETIAAGLMAALAVAAGSTILSRQGPFRGRLGSVAATATSMAAMILIVAWLFQISDIVVRASPPVLG